MALLPTSADVTTISSTTTNPRRRATVSACIIARDNARTISACLKGIRPRVDQLVVVDTGSVDDTKRLALAAGAEVYDFPWIDDFAAARNASLAYARGDWVFWLDPELLFRHAILEQQAGRPQAAARCYRQLLTLRGERYFSSIDVGLTGYKARHNLALIYEELGRADLAEVQWRAILREHPGYRPAIRALGAALVDKARSVSLEVLWGEIAPHDELAPEACVLRGEICRLQGNLAEAESVFAAGSARFPAQSGLWQAWGRLLFETGAWAAAEPVLTKLRELQPDDAATLHNLAQVHRQTGRPTTACDLLRESLRLRPNAPRTAQALAEVEAELNHAAAPALPPQSQPPEEPHVPGNV